MPPSCLLSLGLCAAFVTACAGPELGVDVAAVQNYVITVNSNGSFTPSSLPILEGDSVTFQGPGGAELRTTDAIVRVPAGNLGASCITTGLAYDTTHLLPGDDNELTGPLRRGTSGIYALGPEEAEGFVEGALAASTLQADIDVVCNAAATVAGVAAPTGEEIWVGTLGTATTRCQKHKLKNGIPDKTTTTNSPYLLDSTWDDPDLAGAVVRINWADLYTVTTSGGLETYAKNWSKLDHELDQAARRGKLVLLEVLAGDGIPAWLFEGYDVDQAVTVDATATGLTALSVLPIATRDYGSSDAGMPASCGYDKLMGSPADPDYRTAVVAMLTDVAAHIRGNGSYYQALGSFKVTGLNFLTGEMRLPHRCLVPADTGYPDTECWCNSQIWAAPLGTQVAAYDDPDTTDAIDPPMVNGGGYSADVAEDFMRVVENTLYWQLGRRKTAHYMLIQDGFPKVDDEEHYDMDEHEGQVGPWTSPWGADNFGYVDASGAVINFASQTQAALDSGRNGEFAHILADGSPGIGGDPQAHKLFAVMHAGLGTLPTAVPGLGVAVGGGAVPNCAQQIHHPAALVNNKYEAALHDPALAVPGGFGDDASYGQVGSGCPSKWAVREGYRNQVMGFQTTNDLVGGDDLSSVLWNATLNSNAVFVEAYEGVLWTTRQARLAGATVLSTSAAGYAEITSRQKSLAAWATELHHRRRTLATLAGNDQNRHMKDPFPASYTFTFKKDLTANQVTSYRFINPAARCAAGTLVSGRIDVTGR